MKTQLNRRHTGFTLIEVMITVAVLAFGLLAMATLQSVLTRASSETRAQAVGLSLAKGQLEQLRSYRTLADYQGIDSIASGSAQVLPVGEVNFRRWQTVTRYAFRTSTGRFEAIASNTAALPTGYGASNEFKQVTVSVSWVDASGTVRTTALEDAVAAVDPADSAKLTRVPNSSGPRNVKVAIWNPSNTDGVIPIAIGNGSDTAATNPTPEVSGRGSNNERVVETRFDVLTYKGSGTTATAQSRIETAVVGCTCNVTTGGGGVGKRPTYWTGERYSVPDNATFSAPAGVAANLPVPESPRCTICCRDHHDNSSAAPGRVASTKAKFDPRRSPHDHYNIDSITSTTVGALATGDYVEACRIIRVDGSFRVAADTFNDSINLLGTANGSDGIAQHSPVPSATATTNYAGPVGAVLSYMGTRFVTGTNYNARSALSAVADFLHPGVVEITKSIFDYKWQHARGLYIDFLEPEAIAMLAQAKADCVTNSCTAAARQAAILRLLPFTSINLSEVANWRSYGTKSSLATESNDLISVTNDDFLESILYPQPVRGNALPGFQIPLTPTSGVYDALASAEIFESNSGLALLLDPVDPAEFVPVSDAQLLRLSGSSGSAFSGTYTVTIPKGSNPNPDWYFFSASSASYPRIGSSPNTSRCTYSTKGGAKPNPYTCGNYKLGTAAAPQPITVTISKYNYTDTSKLGTGALTCSGTEGSRSYSGPYPVNTCKNYGLTAPVTVSPARTITTPYVVSNSGLIGETTAVTFSDLRAGDQITMPLRFENETTTPMTCSYQVTVANNGTKSYNYFTVPDPCP